MKIRTQQLTGKHWLIVGGIGIAVFLLILVSNGGFSQTEPGALWRCVCDALFIPGILLTSFGLLLWAADGGVFDMLKFMMQKVFTTILSEKKRARYPKTFYDYKVQREAKGRARIIHFMVIGLGFIAAAGIALILYAQYESLV